MSKRLLPALLLFSMFAASALGQSEFARAFGGEISVITIDSARLSGSLGITFSRSQFPFGSGGDQTGYAASFGGTVVPDRLWFFASAQRSESLFSSPRLATMPAYATGNTRDIDASAGLQLGDRQTLAATFSRGEGMNGLSFNPETFLSLRYTGIVSPNMFITGSVSRTEPGR